MSNPTGILTVIINESISPIRKGIEAVVRELLGGKAADSDVRLCQMSIMAQCFHTAMARQRKAMKGRCGESLLRDMDIEKIADHVTLFSIEGIRGIRKRLGSKSRHKGAEAQKN